MSVSNDGVILVQSKYGAAQKYADWLSEKTSFPVLPVKSVSLKDVTPYKVIILCGGIYASGIAGLSFIKKNISSLKGKDLFVFCCGASPYEPAAFEQIVSHNLKNELSGIPCFYGRGSWDMKNMTLKDRLLCKALQKAVAKKDPETLEPWQSALLESGDGPVDWRDPDYLLPLIEALEKD